MEEQLISLETAKLAKEKGFDWECNCVFFEDGIDDDLLYYEASAGKTQNSLLEEHYFSCDDKPFCTAPTQSLLQKWLREVHKIDVYSTWGTYLEKTVWYFYNSKISIGATFSSKKHWNTYEEALEAGLFEALNLIKNE